jgi:ketosteroid isomerase-like protein
MSVIAGESPRDQARSAPASDVREDRNAILNAKTHYREAYNTADPERLLSVFASEFTDCSDGEPSFYGHEAVRALRLRTQELFQCFRVEMVVTVVEITVKANFACDWGWHKVRLIDKDTGNAAVTRYRYFETWKKESGRWKIAHIITNEEQPPRLLPSAQVMAPTPVINSGAEPYP